MSGTDYFHGLKSRVIDECLAVIESKIQTVQGEFNIYKESAANETKSTAGDKHDTAKSMMQMEQEKLSAQLHQLLEQRRILETLDKNKVHDSVKFGSLVNTDRGLFFISASITTLTIDSQLINPVSTQSPLGKGLLGKAVNESIEIHGKLYNILSIN